MAAEYSQQWATLFMLLTSDTPINSGAVAARIRETLPDWEFEPFSEYTTKITTVDGVAKTGPWVGRLNMPGTNVLSIKMNARTRNREAASSLTPDAMNKLRTLLPQLRAQSIFDSYSVIYPYGMASTFTKDVDKGLPPTPAMPPEPEVSTSWAMLVLLLAGGVALFVEKKKAFSPALAGVNREDMTFTEWLRAARKTRARQGEKNKLRRAWKRGEDPTEYA